MLQNVLLTFSLDIFYFDCFSYLYISTISDLPFLLPELYARLASGVSCWGYFHYVTEAIAVGLQ